MLPLTIWMNMPSFYQDDLFTALAASGEIDLQVVFARPLAEDRKQLGWEERSGDYSRRTLSDSLAIGEAYRVARSQRDRIHIINGIWAEPAFAAALCALALRGSAFAIYAEAPDPGQPRSGLKKLFRRAFGSWVARRARGMLAISRLAEDYYLSLGFSRDRIYRFGYFRAAAPGGGAGSPVVKERTEIIFVGQFVHRKGLDILLEALSPLFAEYPRLCLTLVGAGQDAPTLREQVKLSGLTDRVLFEGVASSDKIQARLAEADLLVLPSRWDGWGLVVNEALSVGVPVIVSDRCGAADLIRPGANGYVFRSEDVEDLRRSLRAFLGDSRQWPLLKAEAAATGRAISAESAAFYLIDCLKHMTGRASSCPVPPWALLETSQSTQN